MSASAASVTALSSAMRTAPTKTSAAPTNRGQRRAQQAAEKKHRKKVLRALKQAGADKKLAASGSRQTVEELADAVAKMSPEELDQAAKQYQQLQRAASEPEPDVEPTFTAEYALPEEEDEDEDDEAAA